MQARGSYASEEYASQVQKHYRERADKLTTVVTALESAALLARTLRSQIATDASEVVNDMMGDHVEEMEAQYLLESTPTKRYNGDSSSELEVSEPPPAAPPSLNRRGITLTILMVFIAAWTIALTFGLVFLFSWFESLGGHIGLLVDSFAEGLSGGSFLATIAGTMMPRLQQDAYRSRMNRMSGRILGLFVFQAGLLFAVALELFTSINETPVHAALSAAMH